MGNMETRLLLSEESSICSPAGTPEAGCANIEPGTAAFTTATTWPNSALMGTKRNPPDSAERELHLFGTEEEKYAIQRLAGEFSRPVQRIDNTSDIRKTAWVVKDSRSYKPEELYAALGMMTY